MTGVYNPKAFILHAASHRQTFVHCECSSTAASRRSLGSISVPVGLVILSDQLTVGLGGPLPRQQADGARAPPRAGALRPPLTLRRCRQAPHPVLAVVSNGFPRPKGRLPTCSSPIRHSHGQLLLTGRSRSTCMPNPRYQRSF